MLTSWLVRHISVYSLLTVGKLAYMGSLYDPVRLHGAWQIIQWCMCLIDFSPIASRGFTPYICGLPSLAHLELLFHHSYETHIEGLLWSVWEPSKLRSPIGRVCIVCMQCSWLSFCHGVVICYSWCLLVDIDSPVEGQVSFPMEDFLLGVSYWCSQFGTHHSNVENEYSLVSTWDFVIQVS